jgi:lysophospholipase L1-like esterase
MKLFGDRRNRFCLPENVALLSAVQKRVAGEFACEVIDMTEVLAGKTGLWVDDGVHLSEAGNIEMARVFLDYLRTHPTGGPATGRAP